MAENAKMFVAEKIEKVSDGIEEGETDEFSPSRLCTFFPY
jgi:hypothetical protein